MEVDEEDCGSGHFRFPDNSTALNAETIREDPAPSTSRMVVALSSRAFRANKTKARRDKLRSINKPIRRKAMGALRQKTPSTGLMSTSSGTAALLEEDQGQASSSHFQDMAEDHLSRVAQLPVRQVRSSSARDWRDGAMTAIEEDCHMPVGHIKFHCMKVAPPSDREMRMARAEIDREERSGKTIHRDRLLAALRVNVQRMKAMSKDNPAALRETLPDETIAMMRRFHI